MDQITVKELIEKFSKSSNKDNIYRALLKLKTNLVTDKHGIEVFYENNGIPPLVRLITKPYEKIIDISLSILGNCCTIKCCCEQALENGVVSPLLTILRSIKNESIQSRACRLLGNLARECNGKVCTCTKGFGTVLSGIIAGSTNVLTLTCAIRAVRMLWIEKRFYDEFSKHDGSLYIKEVLIKYSKCKDPLDRFMNGATNGAMNGDHSVKHEKSISSSSSSSSSLSLPSTPHRSPNLSLPINVLSFDGMYADNKDGIYNDFEIPTNVQELNLICEVFRCFQVITTNPLIYFLNHELAYCIISYAQHNSPFRTMALKLLTCFTNKSGPLTYFIQNEKAVNIVLDVLCKTDIDPPKTESELIYCIEIITNLSSDSCNRAKIRYSDTFKCLLEIAKTTTSDRVLLMIIQCFQAFRYDNMSMDELVQVGLINLLITVLNVRTADITEKHKLKKKTSKRCNAEKLYKGNVKRIKNADIKSNLLPFMVTSKTDSPCSPTTSLSPYFSPFRVDDTGIEDSEYSPVCSDIEDAPDNDDAMTDKKSNDNDDAAADDDGNDNDAMDNNDDVDNDNGIDIEETNVNSSYGNEETKEIDSENEESELQDDEQPALPPISLKIIQCLVDLLGNAARRIGNQHCISLCQERSLISLIKTCRLLHPTKDEYIDYKRGAPYVLYSIISCAKNFVTLLQNKFIYHVFALTQPMHDRKECETCEKLNHLGKYLLHELCEMAETGYGVGEMAHLLIKGDKKMQNQVAVIAPLIIRKHLYLHNLLIYHKGIHTIINIILTPDEELATEAANSLTVLSSKLNLKCIQELKNITVFKCSSIFSECDELYDKSNIDQNDLITFVVGGGGGGSGNDELLNGKQISEEQQKNNHIKFNGEILKKNSEFFDVMLSSNFRESNEKRIYLKDQTIVGVKYFLNSIVQYANKKLLNKPLENDINCILEAYDLCQIYMLKELEGEMYNMIVFSMTPKTILNIFEFSMVKQKMELIEITINYYLSANLERDEKVEIFRQVNESKFGKDWYEIIVNKFLDSFIKYDS